MDITLVNSGRKLANLEFRMNEKREFQWKLKTRMVAYQHIPMMSLIGGKMILRTCFQIPQRLIMDNHLNEIKQRVQNNTVPSLDTNISLLNEPITREEVENSLYRAKLNRAPGFYAIPAEVLRNSVCIDLLYRIINFCFENGSVPSEWNKPISKSDANDPRDPLCYLRICLISIPCKVYADILNVRFSQWIDENNIVVDEQNGFRRNRSCLEQIYALFTVINKRKQQNNLRLFAL